MLIDVLVLNHNGRGLLEECLPSVLRAADASRHVCRVAVVDNASTDDSFAWLDDYCPEVEVIHCANRGLCSFNEVLARRHSRVAVLLNNDIKLDEDCLDPLIEPLLSEPRLGEHPCFLTAPQCWGFDGQTYDGQKTAVLWRWGLVQATSWFPGHEGVIEQSDWTANAGAAIAVDREMFLQLGGFDPLYLPGRLEDLDFCYRGYQAGWHALYVPEAVAYHLGAATFGKTFTSLECQRLALRNTLLFQWKNLRHPWHIARHICGLAARLAWDVLRWPLVDAAQRLLTWKAVSEALRRFRNIKPRCGHSSSTNREREFFHRFSPQRLAKRVTRVSVVEPSAGARECVLSHE